MPYIPLISLWFGLFTLLVQVFAALIVLWFLARIFALTIVPFVRLLFFIK